MAVGDRERNSEIAFMLELAHGLGIGTMKLGLACPEHLYGDLMPNLRKHLGEAALDAIKTQQLAGRLALEAYQRYGPSSLKHGSNLSPKQLTPRMLSGSGRIIHPVLKPQQAFWRDKAGRKFKDGDPAICTTGHYRYPQMRSLLNRNHLPDFEGVVFTSQNDNTGTSYDFTSQAFLSALAASGQKGWVYTITKKQKPEYQELYRNPITNAAWEYRIFEDVDPKAWIATTPTDLPPELIVIDGDANDAFEFVRTLPQAHIMDHIEAYASRINVQPVGGFFPLNLHPNVR
jgi:hypothetical protein